MELQNSDVMARVPTAILNHEVTSRMEAKH